MPRTAHPRYHIGLRTVKTGLAVLIAQMRAKIAVRFLIVALTEQIDGQVRTLGRLFALLQRNLPFWAAFAHSPCI